MKTMAKISYICVGVAGMLAFMYAVTGHGGMAILAFLGALFNWYVAELNNRIGNQDKEDDNAL